VVTTNVEDIYPLSPMQRGMLLHTLQDSSGDMYLQQDVYIVDGHLDTNLLIEAWQQVFAAHPALRTSFQWDGLDQPLQVVHRTVTPPTRLEDWRGQPEEEQQQRLDELLSKDRASGFDLTRPPLQRLLVVRLGDERDVAGRGVGHVEEHVPAVPVRHVHDVPLADPLQHHVVREDRREVHRRILIHLERRLGEVERVVDHHRVSWIGYVHDVDVGQLFVVHEREVGPVGGLLVQANWLCVWFACVSSVPFGAV